MIAKDLIEEEIQAQKRIISQLKREIFGVDKTSKSRYIKDFHAEFNRYTDICPVEDVLDKAASSDIAYFGDYHPLTRSQEWVCRLMKELTARDRKVVLAIEMLYDHQQEHLDRWMKGTISEEEFLDAISYRLEWGFNWESYKRIFTLAKDPFIPIFGIDSEPRDNLKYIRTRDRLIAQRIRNIRNFFPDHMLLVVIGESHLASNHLPADVRKGFGDGFHDITIVQNIDEIYWDLLKEGKEDTQAVRIDENRFCIFTASPILKYQAYRGIIHIWIEGVQSDRQTSVLQEMVENIVSFLVGRNKKLTVTIKGDWRESLDGAFPDVVCMRTYRAFSTYLRSKRIGHESILNAIETLKNFNISYVPAINAFLVADFGHVRAAQEAARFVLYALRDEIGRRNKVIRWKDDQFYASVFEEALVYFGSKIVNPTQDCIETDLLLGTIDARGVVREGALGFSITETRRLVRLLKYHFKREKKRGGSLKVTRRLREIHDLEAKRKMLIVRTLGHTLGEALYQGFHEGQITREQILGLYHENFQIRGTAKALYMEWTRKAKPYRDHWGT